jgi:sec-independent protein translocase protein TatA
MAVAELLGPDLLVILVIVALLFGTSRLPRLARALGSAKSEFEKGVREGQAEDDGMSAAEEKVTMTRAELDRLIAEREARGRGETSPS